MRGKGRGESVGKWEGRLDLDICPPEFLVKPLVDTVVGGVWY